MVLPETLGGLCMPMVEAKDMLTMRQVADLVRVNYKRFWRFVRERRLIAAPKHLIDNRLYYDRRRTRLVIEQVAELRAKGVL
jgi:hypothetical protein